jgi:hypothetical protein
MEKIMKTKQKILTILTTLLITTVSYAGNFQLKSNDITQDKFMPKAQEFQGFGCNGSNLHHNYHGLVPPRELLPLQYYYMTRMHLLVVGGGTGKL